MRRVDIFHFYQKYKSAIVTAASGVIIFVLLRHLSVKYGIHDVPVIIPIALATLGIALLPATLSALVQGTENKLEDSLTKLPNRIAFRNRLNCILKNYPVCCVLFLLDINRFKEVNDTLGHSAGDRLLIDISGRLSNALKPFNGTLCRIGGDEFAFIFVNTNCFNSYKNIATIISNQFLLPFVVDEHRLIISASIGVTIYPDHGLSVTDLIKNADIAMYESKKRMLPYFMFTDQILLPTVDDLELPAKLKYAIGNNQLELYFQPKKDIRLDKITSVESLVRWRHPQLGIMPPDRFIHIAEESGAIKELTCWVVDAACRAHKEMKSAGFDLSVSVNVSPNDVTDTTMLSTILSTLIKYNMNPSKLTLEVTETALMKDPDSAFKVLVGLESLGIKISLDDFGVGHSSFLYLKNFPVSEIKLDRSFISFLKTNTHDFNIVKATIGLAHDINATVVAEGVETKEVEDLLKSINCDFAQGYYLSEPKSLGLFIKWLEQYHPVQTIFAVQQTQPVLQKTLKTLS